MVSAYFKGLLKANVRIVLILIMLEGGFCYEITENFNTTDFVRLNPYYAGRWFLLAHESDGNNLVGMS